MFPPFLKGWRTVHVSLATTIFVALVLQNYEKLSRYHKSSILQSEKKRKSNQVVIYNVHVCQMMFEDDKG